MRKPSLFSDYLEKYAASVSWKMHVAGIDGVHQVVVIPAYAEKENLFKTLASLCGNPPNLLKQTLVLCVVNNKANAPDEDKQNNAQTIAILTILINQSPLGKLPVSDETAKYVNLISESPIRLACIDASSSGLEIPLRVGGVGMARKIGMDTALRILQCSNKPQKLIYSLDADTLICKDYLQVIRQVFSSEPCLTAVVCYEHQLPDDPGLQEAISSYEIFLRYVLLGLRYAGSPYAFHTIGSTIVTTADAYLAVRGMNRREAGEDFYFLNKLAKVSPIRTISETKVYPSGRISGRVPFGTGAAVQKIISQHSDRNLFYDPRIFQIIREWIFLMEESFSRTVNQILSEAQKIHPGLAHFLVDRKFLTIWPRVRDNLKNKQTYNKQFNNWFDGFETLKLINYMTKEHYPRLPMMQALKGMKDWLKIDVPSVISGTDLAAIEEKIKILQWFRSMT